MHCRNVTVDFYVNTYILKWNFLILNLLKVYYDLENFFSGDEWMKGRSKMRNIACNFFTHSLSANQMNKFSSSRLSNFKYSLDND